MSSPTFANAVLSQDGLSVQVTFNQVGANAAMLPASGVTGLTILNGSTPVTISSSARVSNFAYKFALSGAQAAGSVLTLACTPGNLTDSASNAVASFSGQAAQYSIPELIAQNVLYALGQITTANGYTVTASPSRPLTAKEPASKTDLVIDIMEPTTREIPVLRHSSSFVTALSHRPTHSESPHEQTRLSRRFARASQLTDNAGFSPARKTRLHMTPFSPTPTLARR